LVGSVVRRFTRVTMPTAGWVLVSVVHSVVSATTLQGAGASFPVALYHDAMFSYRSVASNIVAYTSTGSGRGKCRVKDWASTCDASDTMEPHVVDFAGSDSVLAESEYAAFPDLQMYPTVAGAVVPVYNLPSNGSSMTLVLTVDLLAKIFRSAITGWNDPAIAALNPNLQLPNARITVCVRSDKSGTTEIFKTALALAEPAFSALIGTSSSASWTNATVSFRGGNSGVAAFVAETAFSIGYVGLADAQALGLSTALIRKVASDGRVSDVAATVETISRALAEADFGNNGDDPARLTASLAYSAGLQSWPIAGYTYLVIRKATTHFAAGQSCASRRATVDFWLWFYSSSVASQLATAHMLVPLPS
jgi:phosphate transport system substrate-binding protein